MDFLKIATGIIYLFLGTVFFVTGLLLIARIKSNLPGFYISIKKPIWLATLLLSASLWVRGGFNLFRYFD